MGGWKRGHTRLLLFVIVVVGHLATNKTSYYIDVSLFSQQENNGNNGTASNTRPLEVKACTPEQMSTIKMQLPPEDCERTSNKPWEQKCSLSYATRCPDAVWLERYYTQLHSEQKSKAPPFLGIFVGCNKGFDAVNALRMGSGNPLYDKDVWRKAMTDDGRKNLDRSVCSQATSAQFELRSNGLNSTKPEVANPEHKMSAFSSSQVHCIEPMPDTALALQKAAWMTKYDKNGLIVTRAAMASEDGFAEFARSRKNGAVGVENTGISTGCNNNGHLVGCVNVTKYSLDTYVEKFISQSGKRPINYLSLDVEGWDAEVLSGGYQSALAMVQYLEFEYNWVGPWKDQSLYDVVDYLDENFGFTCYWAGFNNTIWRITNCWLNHYDIHSWSNVACVNRNFNEVRTIAEDMEQLFLYTLAKGADALRDFEHRYRHPEPKIHSANVSNRRM